MNGNVVDWTLCYMGTNPPSCGTSAKGFPNVEVPTNHTYKWFKFTITKDDAGIVFAADPPPLTNAGPIWIQAGSQPNGPGINGQIEQVSGAGTTELKFRDKNNNKQPLVLKYQLNFTDAQGSSVKPIDPDITNGGKNFFFLSSPLTLAIGAAVGAALLIAWYRKGRA
jgi:hypothetical protein